MKKLVILTTSLLLVSGGINATETLNKLVETKIEQAPITMEAPAPLPIGVKPVGTILKVARKIFKKKLAGLELVIDELSYEKLILVDQNFLNNSPEYLKYIFTESRKTREYTTMGYAMLEELKVIGEKVPKIPSYSDIEFIGSNINLVFTCLGDDIIKTRQNLVNLEYITRQDIFRKVTMEEIFPIKIADINKENIIDEVAGRVRAKIVAESNKEIDLGYVGNKQVKVLTEIIIEGFDLTKASNILGSDFLNELTNAGLKAPDNFDVNQYGSMLIGRMLGALGVNVGDIITNAQSLEHFHYLIEKMVRYDKAIKILGEEKVDLSSLVKKVEKALESETGQSKIIIINY